MKFETPELEIIHIDCKDVVTASGFDYSNSTTISGINGATVVVNWNNISSFKGGPCPFDGYTEGVDFLCTANYNH